VLITSLFAQAGNGAVFALVPLIRPKSAGQVSGLTGAYGNVGGIVFLATLLVVTPQSFFLVMAAASAAVFVACRWLVEPAGSHDGAAVMSPTPPSLTAEESVVLDLVGTPGVGGVENPARPVSV
jgi:NNP family nitrate/nitrite transporter-like MFS transporter